MPIVRSYMCEDCGHALDVTLAAEQWNAEPPECPRCSATPMAQEFRPIAIGGSNIAKASHIAETIAHEDYGAELTSDHTSGPRVRYTDASQPRSSWQTHNADFQRAVTLGRESRRRHGDGLDVLQANLKSGAQPDLIELSKRRSARV